jgi:hypothetical protein
MMIVLLAAASSFNAEASTILEEDFSSNAVTDVGAGWSIMTGTDVRFHEHFEGRRGVLEIAAEKSFSCSHVMYQFETDPNRLHNAFLLSLITLSLCRLAWPCFALICLVLSSLGLSCLVLSYFMLSCVFLSCLILS